LRKITSSASAGVAPSDSTATNATIRLIRIEVSWSLGGFIVRDERDAAASRYPGR
jgi:hypothetical protein